MPMYLVERILPGATVEQVERLHATLEHACSLAREHGTPITYLRSLFTPGESRCRCLFVAPSAQAVRELNDAGGLPYSRIVLAVDLEGQEPEQRRDEMQRNESDGVHEVRRKR
jgi:Protein of unknown function (DUF4242)